MVLDNPETGIEHLLRTYKMHVLIFLIALFIAVTFVHPSLLLTDEWITVNQLSQLHDGHQVILNEGKYGSYENGTISSYFTNRNNYLAYPLFLPLISLPAYWLVDIFGDSLIFFLLYIWTFLLIMIGLLINGYFTEYTHIGKYRWTTGLFIGAFLLFFLNLFVYRPFHIADTYPEFITIVLTNIVIFGFLAVMVYEICRTIFKDPGFTLFGTVVCLACSSYLFWTNFCKDHALIAFLFTAVVLMVVKYLSGTDDHYLQGAFVIVGLLAWARPELALFVFLALCIVVVYLYITRKSGLLQKSNPVKMLTTPFFTLIGAIPFFINNYLFTKNMFVPAWILWKTNSTTTTTVTVTAAGASTAQPVVSDTLGSLISLFMSTINIQPASFFSDLYGVMLNPQNGSMGIFPLVPLFLVALFLLPLVWTLEKIHVSRAEKYYFIIMSLLALGVFLAYVRGLSGMNTSVGIAPDMRYMSPIYLPLDLLGLMIIRKIPSISEKPSQLITWMGITWVVVIPISLVLISHYYPRAQDWTDIFPLLDLFISVTVFLLVGLFLLFLITGIVYKIPMVPARLVLALLCAVPFIWQIDATFIARLSGAGLGGYSFLVPVIFRFYGLVF